MNLATNRNIFLILIFTVLFLVAAGSINSSYTKPSIKIAKQDSALNFNDDLLLLFSAGQKRLITDLFWITTLLESDESHYEGNDLNSWMYLRFKSILKLDPLFLNAYRFGGKYLSIIKDDLVGADEIFSLGLKKFPHDYELLYDAGFLLAFEIQDYKRAIPIYEKLIHFEQAPDFVSSILNKLKFNIHGDLALTFKVIEKLVETTPKETHLFKRLQHDLFRIKAEIDLSCLNNHKEDCSRIDYFGNEYKLRAGQYTTTLAFKPYRLKIKN